MKMIMEVNGLTVTVEGENPSAVTKLMTQIKEITCDEKEPHKKYYRGRLVEKYIYRKDNNYKVYIRLYKQSSTRDFTNLNDAIKWRDEELKSLAEKNNKTYNPIRKEYENENDYCKI